MKSCSLEAVDLLLFYKWFSSSQIPLFGIQIWSIRNCGYPNSKYDAFCFNKSPSISLFD